MKPTIFIDGHNGSTGLRMHQWLAGRSDLTLRTLDDDVRKDLAVRRQAFVESEIAILCLPDEAAGEAAHWIDESDTRVIDASTAHRVDPGWVYGIPELPGGRAAIREAKRVSNPGCYPTAFILLMQPLIAAGIIEPHAPLAIHALSGYSGGGRSLIQRWESTDVELRTLPYEAPYGLDRVHKHMPEMKHYAGMMADPQFIPAVGAFPCGMRVQIPLPRPLLGDTTAESIWSVLHDRYADERFVKLVPLDEPAQRDEESFNPQRCNGTNRIDLHVLSNPAGHVLLMGILDNLGKGASGAAVQNLNVMLDLDEGTGIPR